MATHTLSTTESPAPPTLLWLTKRQWIAGLILFILMFGVMLFSDIELRSPVFYFPAVGIAMGMLYLEGMALWPFVFFAELLGRTFGNYPPLFLLLVPIGQTLQAVFGATLLKRWNIDPIFRSSRDMFVLFTVVTLTSLIAPTVSSLSNILSTSLFGISYPLTTWGFRYTSTVFSLLIITPFILRWYVKPRFSRTRVELFETVGIFLVLIGTDVLIFGLRVLQVRGVSTVYFLIIPLFWIALRLRPRFVTLAFLITAFVGFIGLLFPQHDLNSPTFINELFEFEALIITLSAGFFIVVSLEENRRISANIMRSQLATLQNAVARVTSESQAKNDFIAVLAHELRNPLAPVMSGIEFMKIKNADDEDEIDTLTMMEDRMNTVKRLLDDLLDISRISEGKITLNREQTDLGIVLQNAIVSTNHLIRERHQSFVFKAPNSALYVLGDPVRLEQVFTNLISNASRYTDSGGQISLTLSQESSFARIEVKDTGIGIPREALQHIFLPFHQVEHGAKAKKGLGIGLALVKNFVEMHGGTVIAESEGKGKGSVFTVMLPLAAE